MDPEMRAYLDEMRRWLESRFDAIDGQFAEFGGRLAEFDGRFAAVDGGFASIDGRFVDLESGLRRHFGVLIEQVRHEIQIVAEMVVGNTEAIADLRIRLDAR
jgi:hypothetical protein